MTDTAYGVMIIGPLSALMGFSLVYGLKPPRNNYMLFSGLIMACVVVTYVLRI